MTLRWFSVIRNDIPPEDLVHIIQKLSLPKHTFLDIRVEQDTKIEYKLKYDGTKSTLLSEFLGQESAVASRLITPTTRYFYSNSFPRNLESVLARMASNARKKTQSISPDSPPLGIAPDKITQGFYDFYNYKPDPSDVKLAGTKILSSLRARFPQATSIVSMSFLNRDISYASSEESFFSKIEPIWMCIFQLKFENRVVVHRIGWSGRPQEFPDESFDAYLAWLEEFLSLPVLKERYFAPSTPLLFSPDATWTVVHEGLGHPSEADLILSGKSYLAGALGRKITSPLITVVDDPAIQSASYYLVDDEGVKSRGSLIVDDGIFTQYLNGRETAYELGMISSGNARAPSAKHDLYVRQSNLYIEPRDASYQELTENFSGLLIGDSVSSVTDAINGIIQAIFSFGIFFENGEPMGWIKSPFLQGRVRDLFESVSLIGSWVEPAAGYCYKNGAQVPVGSISPFMRLEPTSVFLRSGSNAS